MKSPGTNRLSAQLGHRSWRTCRGYSVKTIVSFQNAFTVHLYLVLFYMSTHGYLEVINLRGAFLQKYTLIIKMLEVQSDS